MDKLISQMIEIFEIQSVSQDDILRNYEMWDSLSVISLIAALDDEFGITIEADDLMGIVTAGDLFAFVESHRTR